MKEEVFEICGMRCKRDISGGILIHIADVAVGLGFERTQVKSGKEYKSIRWDRLVAYLSRVDGVSKNSFLNKEQILYLVNISNNNISSSFLKNKINKIYGKSTAIPVKRKEIEFCDVLMDQLDVFGFDLVCQKQCMGYRIDFYIPKIKLAIEYDEGHHLNKANIISDSIRQAEIEKKLGCTFIRLDHNDSHAKNAAIVLKQIFLTNKL